MARTQPNKKKKDNTSVSHVVIDLDTLIYKACQTLSDVQEDSSKNWDEVKFIFRNLLAMQMSGLNKYLDARSAKLKEESPKFVRKDMQRLETLKMFIGPTNSKENFRFEAAVTSPYKGKRLQEKPPFFQQLREYAIEKEGAIEAKGIEADDAVGITARQWVNEGHNVVVVSHDKDLDQLTRVWRFYNVGDKDINKRPYYVDEDGYFWLERTGSGQLNLFTTGKFRLIDQMLYGDSSDSIPPLKKPFGTLERYKILQEFDWLISENLTSEGILEVAENIISDFPNTISKERLLEQYRLVKIHTYENELDLDLKDIKL